jgi:hypothetical protein
MFSILLYFYGSFLITCGMVSVVLIGPKAKTALISGGASGVLSLVAGYFVSQQHIWAQWAGIALTFTLFCVFAWRSAKTLFRVFELIPAGHPDLEGKGIAFLIISLMAVVSIYIFVLEILHF